MDSNTPNLAHRIVSCPRCKGDSLYAADNPHRPFCSERCKSLDFGAWASESYRVESTGNSLEDSDAMLGPDLAPDTEQRH